MKRTCSGRTTATRGPRFLGRHHGPHRLRKITSTLAPCRTSARPRPAARRPDLVRCRLQCRTSDLHWAVHLAPMRRLVASAGLAGARAFRQGGRAKGVGTEVLCELQPGRHGPLSMLWVITDYSTRRDTRGAVLKRPGPF